MAAKLFCTTAEFMLKSSKAQQGQGRGKGVRYLTLLPLVPSLYDARSLKGINNQRAMLEIFKSAISQLSLSVSEKEQMIHLQRRVFDFLSQGRQADLVEREASRGVELEATESEEERKYRKRAERAARQRYLNHHSINSTPRPLAGAIIYAVCRQNGRPISIGNVAVRWRIKRTRISLCLPSPFLALHERNCTATLAHWI